jgi:hypothetical protein
MMADILASFFGTLGVTAIYGLVVIGFLNLVIKQRDLERQELQREEKEKEQAEAFQKT